MPTPTNLPESDMLKFLNKHQLPPEYQISAEQFFLPLAKELPALRTKQTPLILGINGAQGTGKSTLADFLKFAVTALFDWNVAVLSIDDFYLTRAERARLAKNHHPLLMTRGVPGTHDIDLLDQCLHQLQTLTPGQSMSVPRFEKAIDDRVCESAWSVVHGPVDLIILEGWCVGSQSQADAMLNEPCNQLERDEDKDQTWRRFANDHLGSRYQTVFAQLDALAFLKAPSFAAVLRWRLEQEQKLAATTTSDSAGLMDENQIARFIQHYERITKANLDELNDRAQIVFELDESHRVVARRSN